MRRIIVSAFAALALIIGLAAPSDAFVLAPYDTARVNFGTCAVDVTYGQYGSAPYAAMTEVSGAQCHYNTSIQVAAYYGGAVSTSVWCSHYMRLGNPYPSVCSFNGFSTMAHFDVGTVIGGNVYLCYEPPSGPTCEMYGFGPWG